MDVLPEDTWIYRAMAEEDGKPRLGSTAVTLGIRPNYDIDVDENGIVQRPSFLPGENNGLSCTPDVESLPVFARPERFGGNHSKTVVWRIRNSDLGTRLEAQRDDPDHISIGPAVEMSIADFVEVVEQTGSLWEKVE